MGNWKVGIAYERYGYITVEAENRNEAIKKAEERLEKMTAGELDTVTDYLPDSEEVDREFVEEVS